MTTMLSPDLDPTYLKKVKKLTKRKDALIRKAMALLKKANTIGDQIYCMKPRYVK